MPSVLLIGELKNNPARKLATHELLACISCPVLY